MKERWIFADFHFSPDVVGWVYIIIVIRFYSFIIVYISQCVLQNSTSKADFQKIDVRLKMYILDNFFRVSKIIAKNCWLYIYQYTCAFNVFNTFNAVLPTVFIYICACTTATSMALHWPSAFDLLGFLASTVLYKNFKSQVNRDRFQFVVSCRRNKLHLDQGPIPKYFHLFVLNTV